MIWINEPAQWGQEKEYLWVRTMQDTDFWQRTHYGFQRDSAHAYVREMYGNFVLSARLRFYPVSLYDQCGLLIRRSDQEWFKCSAEYEDSSISRLGSVNTSFGYSDWATQDIASDVHEIWYRLEYSDSDITAQYSYNGTEYYQMRICHFHGEGIPVLAGIYGCSPTGKGFRFEVSELSIRSL